MLVPVVAAAAEEAREEVERVVVPPAAGALVLLVLLEALVAISVVDAALFGVDERFVGFGDFDEFIFYCVITTIFVSTWKVPSL